MLHLWILRQLLWSLSVMFGGIGTFILYLGLTGSSLPLSVYAAIFLGSAIAIVFSLPE